MGSDLLAPFPWFGGKRRIDAEVWRRFGDVPNYVEPFAGSLAVLLGRPTEPKTETVNDLDCYLANFWRALAADPDGLAAAADWPVNEADLHARHRWLLDRDGFRGRMRTDPDYYDAKIAGWWVWGLCQWIGSGWCGEQWYGAGATGRQASQQLPHLSDAGMGIHRPVVALPGPAEWFARLSSRLRRVRVACGDWSRVMGESVTVGHGLTGVLLDPPYSHAERESVYATERDISADVRQWALDNGDNPLLRIALCGYAGEHDMPDTWEAVNWKANGGYGSQAGGRGRANAAREMVWFSPHCLRPSRQRGLFDDEVEGESDD